MDDNVSDTGNPETQELNDNAIFDNGSLDQLTDSFLKQTEPEAEETAEEPTAEEAEVEQEVDETEIVDEAETEEEEVEESDDSEAESEEEDEDQLSDKQQKAFDKRIQRELKKMRKEHEALTADLKAKIKEAEPKPDAMSQLSTTLDMDVVEKVKEDAELTIDFVEEADIEYDSEHDTEGVWSKTKDGKDVFYTKKQLLNLKKNARSAIKEARQRESLIKEKNSFDEKIYQAYPELKDSTSDQALAVSEVFSSTPSLKQDPQGLIKAIYMIAGQEALSQPAKKVAKKASTPKAPKLPANKPAPKKPAAQAKGKLDSEALVASGGDLESLTDAFLSIKS